MKNLKNNPALKETPKSVIKINILYLIIFQLLGIGSALWMEYQPLENNAPEINYVLENTPIAINDIVSYQSCGEETCQL